MKHSIQALPKSIPTAFLLLVFVMDFTPFQSLAQTESDASPEANILFILDGSGSMWGQVENKAKIAIAKEVMTNLIKELPEGVDVGLEVYGHRSKGDCNDIEIMVSVGEGDKVTLIEQIQSIDPKGKTPITAALEMAGERLKGVEEETTVVLVSDGEETCDRDPCELVRALRTQGIRVKVHVVGFDVTQKEKEQLVCIAEAGGGKYFTAQNSNQLKEALTEVKKEVVEKAETKPQEQMPAVPRRPTFIAIDSESGQPVSETLQWTFVNTTTEDAQVLDDQPAELELELTPGEYEIFVTSAHYSGETKITVEGHPNEWHQVQLTSRGGSVIFDAPQSVVAGTPMQFGWRGPNAKGDMVFIASTDMNENEYFLRSEQYHETVKGSPAVLTAPAKPGTYEIRYFSYNNGTTLARFPLEVTTPEVDLNAPRVVAVGVVMEIPWRGPNAKGDMIFIANPDMEKNQYPLSSERYHPTVKGSPAVLTAPAKPGTYEIRYFSYNNGTTLAKRVLVVR